MTARDRQDELAGVAPAPSGNALLQPAVLARVLPFATYMLFIAFVELLARMGFGAADLRWLYGFKVGAVVLVLLLFRRHYTELTTARLAVSAGAVAAGVGLLVLALWVSLNADWMQIGASAGFDPRDGARIDWPLVALRIAGAALVVPVMEELFWRSFLSRWLDAPNFAQADPAAVPLKSVLITSVLFGFEHNLWLAGIVAGLAYGLLYRRHRTLWSPILAHAVTNGALGVWVVATGNWSYW
jgi:CAAX prenyl protease-like protein